VTAGRWRSRLRRAWLDAGPLLGSWRLSIVLMVLTALYFALLAIWAAASAADIVRRIAQLAPFWIVYLLLLVNTTVCFVRRWPMLRRDLARRGRTQLGSFLFHGSFLLLASGFLLTLLGRQETRFWLASGETFEGRPDQVLSQSAPRLLSGGSPALAFRLDRLETRFWADQLLFTRYAAELEFEDGGRRRTRINRPLWVGPASFLRLAGYGFAPRYELLAQSGIRIDSAVVKLNVFPSGVRDYFVIPRYPHRVYVEVYPDYEEVDGRPATRSQNLERPRVVTEIRRGRLPIARGVVGPDEGLAFEGLTLRFPEIVPWGEFELVQDPGAPVVFLGFLVGLAGLALKLTAGWGRREPDGALAEPAGGVA